MASVHQQGDGSFNISIGGVGGHLTRGDAQALYAYLAAHLGPLPTGTAPQPQPVLDDHANHRALVLSLLRRELEDAAPMQPINSGSLARATLEALTYLVERT